MCFSNGLTKQGAHVHEHQGRWDTLSRNVRDNRHSRRLIHVDEIVVVATDRPCG